MPGLRKSLERVQENGNMDAFVTILKEILLREIFFACTRAQKINAVEEFFHVPLSSKEFNQQAIKIGDILIERLKKGTLTSLPDSLLRTDTNRLYDAVANCSIEYNPTYNLFEYLPKEDKPTIERLLSDSQFRQVSALREKWESLQSL